MNFGLLAEKANDFSGNFRIRLSYSNFMQSHFVLTSRKFNNPGAVSIPPNHATNQADENTCDSRRRNMKTDYRIRHAG